MKCKHEIEVDKFGDRTCKHCWLRESTIKAEAKEKQCECPFCQGLMSPGVQPGKDCLKYGAPEHMKMYEEIEKILSRPDTGKYSIDYIGDIKQLFTSLLSEIIGDDKEIFPGDDDYVIENALKTEQRLRAKERGLDLKER